MCAIIRKGVIIKIRGKFYIVQLKEKRTVKSWMEEDPSAPMQDNPNFASKNETHPTNDNTIFSKGQQ